MEENDDNIRSKIRSLDEQFPEVDWTPEDAWDSIGKRKTRIPRVRLGVAAAVLIGLVIFFLSPDKEKITVVYREEQIYPEDSIRRTDSWSLIEESCRAKLVVCESKKFIELKTQWEELQKENEALNNEEKTYGHNPAILRAKKKVESVKEDLEEEMLAMINS